MKTKHIWRLLMLLFLLTILFVVESILLLPIQWNTNSQSRPMAKSRQERESKIEHAIFRHKLIQAKRNRSKNSVAIDSTSLHLPKHLLPPKKANTSFSNIASRMLDCEDVLEMSLVKRIGRGTTKEVWKATYQGKEVAIKMVSHSVADIKMCMNRIGNQDREEQRRCYIFANYKLMKEISLLMDLKHSNIIKILGYCILQDESIFGDDHSIVSVVEIGDRLSKRKVMNMPWSQRIQFSIDVLTLLHHLETSSIGSLLLADFKISQMVIVNGTMKLADLDDIAPEETNCTQDSHCHFGNRNLGVQCSSSMCHGRNSKLNLLSFFEKFHEIIFKDVPDTLETEVKAAVKKLENLQVSSGQLVEIFKTFQRKFTK
ncbi:extracellular tyrosine-protein kinase PKDCC-like [Antedon mediterranea]|uniref:extracellular tyrosine-protein kinase PKDCC-like n=1 Tax=Antedon mediterranea TaxID=105859 RepID=UPI003AF8C1D7